MSEGKYAYELEGWLEGKKIRRKEWDKEHYIKFLIEKRVWSWDYKVPFSRFLEELFRKNDWEYFKETKKITLYRYTCQAKEDSKNIHQTGWISETWKHGSTSLYNIIKTETKEIKIEGKDE